MRHIDGTPRRVRSPGGKSPSAKCRGRRGREGHPRRTARLERALVCVCLAAWMLACVTAPAPEDAAPPTTPTLETVEPSATPAPRPEFTVVELVETHTDVETVDTTEFPADNCQGTQLFALHRTASHATTDQVFQARRRRAGEGLAGGRLWRRHRRADREQRGVLEGGRAGQLPPASRR